MEFYIQCDTKIEARRPDIVAIDKTKKEVKIVDVTILGVVRLNKREVGKIEKYKVLKDEIARMLGMKEVIVIPVVVGGLGAISTGFEKYIASIGIEMKVEHPQKAALLGTARILRLVLGCKKKHHKCHCAGLCETFDNRLLSTLTESAGATKNNALSIIIIINNNNNNNNNSKSKQLNSKLH